MNQFCIINLFIKRDLYRIYREITHTHTGYMHPSIYRHLYRIYILMVPFLWLIQTGMRVRKKWPSLKVWEFGSSYSV